MEGWLVYYMICFIFLIVQCFRWKQYVITFVGVKVIYLIVIRIKYNVKFIELLPVILTVILCNVVFSMIICKIVKDLLKAINDNKVLNRSIKNVMHALPESIIIHSDCTQEGKEVIHEEELEETEDRCKWYTY